MVVSNAMTEPRFFSLDYLERTALGDGTPIYLRLIGPDDKDALRAGFDRLSPASRYARFLAPKAALSDDELRYLCEVDNEQHFAIGAALDDGAHELPGIAGPPGRGAPVGLGVARFIRLPDLPNTAEAAIAVVDEMQHRGLGQLLFLRLVAAAAERGIERFRCEVLTGNAGMSALIAQIDPHRTIEIGDGVMSVEVVLPRITATESPGSCARHHQLYRLFRAAAENAAEWSDAVRKLFRSASAPRDRVE